MSGTTRRSRRGAVKCKRNGQVGGGTVSYGFGADITSAHPGNPEVLRQEPSLVSRPGMVSGNYGPLPGMRGGRYMIDPGAPLFPGSDAATRSPIACEGSRSPVPTMRGGSAPVTMNPMLMVPTAGYAFGADSSKSAIGTPIQIQVPYDAEAMNPACIKTGGKRVTRRNGRKQRKNRKNRKDRKNRKNRKTQRRR
jgi:hypothetical protein